MLIETVTQFIQSHLTPAATATPLPLLLVALFSLTSVALYAMTKGKEFPICGYASLLYLIPFIR